MTGQVALSAGRYALRHVDAAGATHLWTCAPTSAHWVARWHAHDSGRDTQVLRDDGDGWRVVTTWTAPDGADPTYLGWSDDGDDGWPDLDGEPAEGLHGYSADCIEDDCDHCEQPDGCDCSCHLDDGWPDDYDDGDCRDPLHVHCHCYDPPDESDDDEETSWRYRPIIDYAAL